MTLGLSNMRALLDAIGHPERAFKSVLVAGTNGKGSVTGYAYALLTANGVNAGWFCSPHVYSVTERISVRGRAATVDEMERAAALIVPLHDRIPFSYFEALTAMAFLIFAERGVDVAVLETGLGGRFDSTNVVDPVVGVLTSISIDHRRLLGDTEEEILREKLGITRQGVPFLVGPVSPALRAIVDARAERDGFEVRHLQDIGRCEVAGTDFTGMSVDVATGRHDYGRVTVPLFGRHQAVNALLAIAATEYFVNNVAGFDEAASALMLPGRFEVHSIAGKTVVLDVAHNDAALAATARTLALLSPPQENALLLGMLRRKELDAFPNSCADWFRRVLFVDSVPGETYTGPQLAAEIGIGAISDRGIDVEIGPALDSDGRWHRLWERLLGPAVPQKTILATGSFRTVDVAGRYLRRGGYIA
jgi:dihydrofolate synthase/folylpolyglutamate synthase